MSYKGRKIRLTKEEVIREIYNRTGIPINGVYQVMLTYNEIITECLKSCVEVPIGDIGFFSWTIKVPRKNISLWNPKTKSHKEPQDLPGCYTPNMRWNKKWKDGIKEATRYWDDNERPE